MNWFAPTRTVTQGVWVLFFVAAGVVVLFIGWFFTAITSVTEVAREAARTSAIERQLQQLGEDLLNAETGQRGYLLTFNEVYLGPFNLGSAEYPQHLEQLHKLIETPEAAADLKVLEGVVAEMMKEFERTVEMTRLRHASEALDLVRTDAAKALMDQFRHQRQQMVGYHQALLDVRRTKFASTLNTSFWVTGISGGLALLILIFTALSTASRLKRPISGLLSGIRAMAQGQQNFHVEVKTHDEIGTIADAFNTMVDHVSAAQRSRDTALTELEKTNADLDSFAYVASHDLKAPLRGIRNLAEWIQDDVKATASEETMENLRLLSNRADRLEKLLDGLLAYSRAGRKPGSSEWVKVSQLLDEIRDYLAPGPHFQITQAGDLPALLTLKAPLELVLRNLINNAIKHHDRNGGTIVISSRDAGDYVELSVADDGPGIAAEFHERIFQMFQTLRPRDEVEGSGMGLAIVKKTVEAFGGGIQVASAPPQRGTTFSFTWPQRSSEAASR